MKDLEAKEIEQQFKNHGIISAFGAKLRPFKYGMNMSDIGNSNATENGKQKVLYIQIRKLLIFNTNIIKTENFITYIFINLL